MTLEHKKQIIIDFIDADRKGLFLDAPAFVPGIGKTPSVKLHVEDCFRIMVENPKNEQLKDGMLSYIEMFTKYVTG
jgi:hypothetical protein